VNLAMTPGRKTLGKRAAPQQLGWNGRRPTARIVFVPTGSAAFDFYGADRIGDDLFANSMIALNAETGQRIWHFQAVRHDIWDRDFPSAPVLITVKHDGKDVDAVAQTTKQGFLYLFDRTDGRPLFPSSIANIQQARFQAKLRLPSSRCRPSLFPIRANF